MAPKRRTTVVCLAASKGGVGKTTLASALAVRATAESKRVALIDLDPQESLESWHERRGSPSNPKVFKAVGDSSTAETIELLIGQRWDWVFIDTPPGHLSHTEPAIAASDFVLIPTRASSLDVEAVDLIAELSRLHDKPCAFVINAAEPRWNLTKTAIALLRSKGHTVIDKLVTYRMAYIRAMTRGRTGAEVEDEARGEIDALWQAVRALTVKGR